MLLYTKLAKRMIVIFIIIMMMMNVRNVSEILFGDARKYIMRIHSYYVYLVPI